jgi:hypothetical protein
LAYKFLSEVARGLTDRPPQDFRRSETSGTEQACGRTARNARDGSGDVRIKARVHGAHAEVQPPTARRPARAGHSRGFLVNNFFWKIRVTLSSEKFTPVPVGTDPFAVIAEHSAS